MVGFIGGFISKVAIRWLLGWVLMVLVWVLAGFHDEDWVWITVEIKFEYGSQWRSSLGFNFVSSSSIVWVLVPVVVGVESGGAVEIKLGLGLNHLQARLWWQQVFQIGCK